MALIKTQLNKLASNYYGRIFLVLFLFLVLSLASLFVFYNGFLINFDLINRRIFGESVPFFVNHVPYHSFSISLSAFLHPYFLLGLAVLYFPLIFYKRSFFKSEFSYQSSEKLLVFSAAFMLTWELVTYNFNYYLNSAFYFDRLILIVLTFSLLRFPLLTPLYIALAFLYRSQFNYPVAGFELYDKRLLYDILLMFVAFRYMKGFVPGFKFSFVWLVLCMVASNYFYTGVAKIIISPHGYEWLIQNNLADLFLNVHLRGWMPNVSEDTLSFIWNFLDSWHVPLQCLVLLTELSAFFLLRNRKLSLIILTASFFLHIGIFCCGSMLFWKWMLIDAVLIYLIITDRSIVQELKYRFLFRTSLVIIVFAFVWLRPLMIGWFDTPANQFFTYEVEDAKGITYQLPKNEMNPYHQWFQYDRFLFLLDKPCLPLSGFGYVYDHKLFKEIKNGTADKLNALFANGEICFNESKWQAYQSFIKTYFANRNKLLNHSLFLSKLAAPLHLYGSSAGLLYKNQAPVIKFRVIYNLTFSSAGKTTYINKSVLHEVPIPE